MSQVGEDLISFSPEILIPPFGVEAVVLSQTAETFNPSLRLSCDNTPLFEIDGIKALAQVKIHHSVEDAQPSTYYVVDVSQYDGYVYESASIEGEEAKFLVVSESFFQSPADGTRFKVLPPSDDANFKRICVGGAYDNTRFGRAGTKNSFGVELRSNYDEPELVITMDEANTADFEVLHHRDMRDPAAVVKTYREAKTKNMVDLLERHLGRKVAGEGYLKAVSRHFYRKPKRGTAPGYDSGLSQNDRNLVVQIYDDLAMRNLLAIDDAVHISAGNASEVSVALHTLETQETHDVSEMVKHELRAKRMLKAVGYVAASAASIGAMWVDARFGGLMTDLYERGIKDALNVPNAVEAAGVVALGYYIAQTSSKIAGLNHLLRKGVNERFLQIGASPNDPNVHDDDLIRSVYDGHRIFVETLDLTAYAVQQKVSNF